MLITQISLTETRWGALLRHDIHVSFHKIASTFITCHAQTHTHTHTHNKMDTNTAIRYDNSSSPKSPDQLWGPPGSHSMCIGVLSRGQSGRGVKLTTRHLVPRWSTGTAIPLLPLCISLARNKMAQAVSRQSLTAKSRVQPQASTCENYGENGTAAGSSPSTSGFPSLPLHRCSIPIHSFIHSFIHSLIHSFIHSSPTTHKPGNWKRR
jgi:hypothetical protein